MSRSIVPPSSLNILVSLAVGVTCDHPVISGFQERYNDSRSTVSSSDTDSNSAGYASSSGTTTPEDDTQTFYLGPTLQNVLADNSKHVPAEKLSIVTRPRNFSSAMKKVKKVVHALVVFKRKVSENSHFHVIHKVNVRDRPETRRYFPHFDIESVERTVWETNVCTAQSGQGM